MTKQIEYNQQISNNIQVDGKNIYCFDIENGNIDINTVDSFGEEWSKFDSFTDDEISLVGNEYFDIVGNGILNKNSTILDVGCGTCRWSVYWSDKVKFIEAIDPSMAVVSAAKLTKNIDNIRISQASVDNIPFNDNSFDFVMSIGVLHHIPDTALALKKIVEKCKTNGHVYIYLYYALDNRGLMFRLFFKLSSLLRFIVSKLPSFLKKIVCDIIAVGIYAPLIGIAYVLKMLIPNSNLWEKIPLSYYINKSFKIIRNDALDRFGTPLEQRFSKQEIINMMETSGLKDIVVSPNPPYWHAIGKKY
jgi:ubiquinone/menaquinone biosynthesis C-methylase UbiE